MRSMKYKFDTIAINESLNVGSRRLGGNVAAVFRYRMDFRVTTAPTDFYTANLGSGIVAIGYKAQPVLVQRARLAR